MKLQITKHYELKDSSIIQSASYNEMTNQLIVRFHAGGKYTSTYGYEGISPDLITAWRKSESVGSFFVEHIKNANPPYKSSKIDG